MSEVINTALQTLLFGEAWYLGILIFIILVVSLMKIWKYAGLLVIPLIIVLEVKYYEQLDVSGNFVWAMLILLFLAIFIAIYVVMGKNKD